MSKKSHGTTIFGSKDSSKYEGQEVHKAWAVYLLICLFWTHEGGGRLFLWLHVGISETQFSGMFVDWRRRPPTHPRPLISPEQCGTQAAAPHNNGPNDTVLLQQDFQYSNYRAGWAGALFITFFSSPKSIKNTLWSVETDLWKANCKDCLDRLIFRFNLAIWSKY